MSVSPTIANSSSGEWIVIEPGECPGVSMMLKVMPLKSRVSSCFRKSVALGAVSLIPWNALRFCVGSVREVFFIFVDVDGDVWVLFAEECDAADVVEVVRV